MSKRIKILHVVSTINGGVGKVIEDYLCGLNSENFDKFLLVLGKLNRLNQNRLKEHNVKIEGWGLANKQHKKISVFVKLFKFLRNNQATIIHVHLFPTLYWCAISSLFIKKEFVYTEHAYKNNRKKWWLKHIEKLIYKRYNTVIAISGSVKKMLNKWTKHKNIVVVENGFDITRLSKINGNNTLKEKLKDKKIITMISRFEEGKDFKTVIDSMLLLDDSYCLVLVGDGSKLVETKGYVHEKQVDDRVFFLGYRDDTLNILRNSNISVLSSEAEGQGQVILESIFVGTLCIGSKVPGIVDVLKDPCFLFEYGNKYDLAAKIKYLNENKNNDVINKKLFNIKSRFDVKRTIDAYETIYKEVISR